MGMVVLGTVHKGEELDSLPISGSSRSDVMVDGCGYLSGADYMLQLA